MHLHSELRPELSKMTWSWKFIFIKFIYKYYLIIRISWRINRASRMIIRHSFWALFSISKASLDLNFEKWHRKSASHPFRLVSTAGCHEVKILYHCWSMVPCSSHPKIYGAKHSLIRWHLWRTKGQNSTLFLFAFKNRLVIHYSLYVWKRILKQKMWL